MLENLRWRSWSRTAASSCFCRDTGRAISRGARAKRNTRREGFGGHNLNGFVSDGIRDSRLRIEKTELSVLMHKNSMRVAWGRWTKGFEIAKGVMDGGLDKARRARETIELTIEHAVQRALTRAKEHGLIHYDDLPEPWKVNPHILKGYRFSEGKWACVRSVVSVHNELINIWTHLLGFLMVLSMAFYFYPSSNNFSKSTKADILIAAVFFFAACKCLACSTIWHTMNSISHQTLLERFACVDYTGISLLVAASIMTTEYAAFYCEPLSRWTHMSITGLLGIGGVILPWRRTFNRADMAWLRVLFYVSLAPDGLPPLWSAGSYSRHSVCAVFLCSYSQESTRLYDRGTGVRQ